MPGDGWEGADATFPGLRCRETGTKRGSKTRKTFALLVLLLFGIVDPGNFYGHVLLLNRWCRALRVK